MPLQILMVLFCYFQATKHILLQDIMVRTHISVFFLVEYERVSESKIQALNNI